MQKGSLTTSVSLFPPIYDCYLLVSLAVALVLFYMRCLL